MTNRDVDITDGVGIITFNRWAQFSNWMHTNFSKYRNYVFRGQSIDSPLLPTLDRVSPDEATRANHLRRFKMAVRGRRGTNPRKLSEDSWWALGQHYGLKTPLRDWTESPFVAAFFGFSPEREPSGGEIVIFALSRRVAKTKDGIPDLNFVEPWINENARLTSQAGLFTKTKAGWEIENWIRTTYPGDGRYARLIKIYIPYSERPSALRALKWMNIHMASLFPDLEGAAGFANTHLQIDGY